jgi:hypothetical protein
VDGNTRLDPRETGTTKSGYSWDRTLALVPKDVVYT